MIVLDPSLKFVVGLTKKKGPRHLIGKLTFPGGKLEEGEAPVNAAVREMKEETGLAIPASQWVEIRYVTDDTMQLTAYAAVCDKFFCAQTCEDEPIWHLEIGPHLGYALRQPEQYSPDFISLLELALQAFEEPQLNAV